MVVGPKAARQFHFAEALESRGWVEIFSWRLHDVIQNVPRAPFLFCRTFVSVNSSPTRAVVEFLD